ncbi:MAG: IclR family transcriptional regulator [Caldilineae bacterium]|nr:MAG: IclR family transcriptional regulator [Caldilineae bacterium]
MRPREDEKPVRATSPVQSIQRAVAILRSFTETEPELSVGELSRRLNLHKSTVSRILATLQQEGLVGQNPVTGRYRLGLGLVSLAGVALGRLDVRGIAQPHLPHLVEITEETINVTVLDGSECVNVERAASPKPIHYVGWIGRRTPVHCTAGGRVFLAFMPEQKRRALLAAPLRRYTSCTITDPEQLLCTLQQVREQGYAVVHGEFEEGFSDVAAPVLNHRREVVAALVVSGPSFRLTPERIASFLPDLLETARVISTKLGWRG